MPEHYTANRRDEIGVKVINFIARRLLSKEYVRVIDRLFWDGIEALLREKQRYANGGECDFDCDGCHQE